MDYAKLLVDAINDYNEENAKSKETLRDLVCVISDNPTLKQDQFLRQLLYIASQKMRVFGYNFLNKLDQNPDPNATGMALLQDESIKEVYRSQVWENNILDKTQKEIINFYMSLPEGKRRMLVSAPTSYGKTFIMREILFLNRDRYNNIMLVFPTVALLRENAESMEKLNRDKNMGYTVIKSIDNEIGEKNIFVFTPERAMQLLANYPELKLDFFFYDEMYKIDEDFCYDETDEKDDEDEEVKLKKFSKKPQVSFLDEARAKTFRICLYLLSKQVEEYYLAGPNLSYEHFGVGMKEYLRRNGIQYKLITFEPTKRIRVDAYRSKIKEFTDGLPVAPVPETAIVKSDNGRISVDGRIANIVTYISERQYGQSLLYCTTPAKANSYASTLAQASLGKTTDNDEYRVFIEHIKRRYDIDGSIKYWSFLNVLEKGFAMHHGKLPKYIQKEVLQLFNSGVFELLFCTSTIVEGVNTDAKNMIVLNSSKGRTLLTGFDLKNIIGRAGRYYHNFLGRYFFLNPELVKIVDQELNLDFATYGDKPLDAIDLDNSETDDLTTKNQITKNNRDEKLSTMLLPNEVFLKNRLIRKEHQEKLLQLLLSKSSRAFSDFYNFATAYDILGSFLHNKALYTILCTLESAELVDSMTRSLYTAIGSSYSKDGFYGILKYQIEQAKKGDIKYDGAYSKAFKTQKDIIEHKIPKLLALFESIYACAANIRNVDLGNFTLSRVIRFYETGVRSFFGEQLIEFGFPIDAVRTIENKHQFLLSANSTAIKHYVIQHIAEINKLLDEYEQRLLQNALMSFN